MSRAVRLAAVLVVSLASTGCSLDKPAWLEQKQQNEAEANFYAEQEYDGRLYVFGTSKLYSQFQATHEMPYSITFIGAGPNGQTVKIEADAKDVALEKRLKQLYEEKHGALSQ
jgi:hypothetical protein